MYTRIHTSLGVDYKNRLEYCAMRAFLTMTDRSNFIALFPEFKEHYDTYAEFTDTVIKLIKHNIRQPSIVKRKPTMKSAAGQVAKSLYEHICKHRNETLNGFHNDAYDIIRDYVINPEYAVLFMSAITKRS